MASMQQQLGTSKCSDGTAPMTGLPVAAEAAPRQALPPLRVTQSVDAELSFALLLLDSILNGCSIITGEKSRALYDPFVKTLRHC
jgi:hypothetical protein